MPKASESSYKAEGPKPYARTEVRSLDLDNEGGHFVQQSDAEGRHLPSISPCDINPLQGAAPEASTSFSKSKGEVLDIGLDTDDVERDDEVPASEKKFDSTIHLQYNKTIQQDISAIGNPNLLSDCVGIWNLFQVFIATTLSRWFKLDVTGNLAKAFDWRSRSFCDIFFGMTTLAVLGAPQPISLAGVAFVFMLMTNAHLYTAFHKIKNCKIIDFLLLFVEITTSIKMSSSSAAGIYALSPDGILAYIGMTLALGFAKRGKGHKDQNTNHKIAAEKLKTPWKFWKNLVVLVVPKTCSSAHIFLYEFFINAATRAILMLNCNPLDTISWMAILSIETLERLWYYWLDLVAPKIGGKRRPIGATHELTTKFIEDHIDEANVAAFGTLSQARVTPPTARAILYGQTWAHRTKDFEPIPESCYPNGRPLVTVPQHRTMLATDKGNDDAGRVRHLDRNKPTVGPRPTPQPQISMDEEGKKKLQSEADAWFDF